MSNLKHDMEHIQKLIDTAYVASGKLLAYASGGKMQSAQLQRAIEETVAEFEKAAIEMRVICEKNSPGGGGYDKRKILPAREITGTVDKIGYTWLHIRLNTLLPHCRFESPAWFSDTIRRLLDDYEAVSGTLPMFKNRAALIIDEHSDIAGRSIYDQDNKGWKAISNALKGRLFPDDDMYNLSVVMLSTKSSENVTHITVMDLEDAGDFLSMHSGYSTFDSVYGG